MAALNGRDPHHTRCSRARAFAASSLGCSRRFAASAPSQLARTPRRCVERSFRASTAVNPATESDSCSPRPTMRARSAGTRSRGSAPTRQARRRERQAPVGIPECEPHDAMPDRLRAPISDSCRGAASLLPASGVWLPLVGKRGNEPRCRLICPRVCGLATSYARDHARPELSDRCCQELSLGREDVADGSGVYVRALSYAAHRRRVNTGRRNKFPCGMDKVQPPLLVIDELRHWTPAFVLW